MSKPTPSEFLALLERQELQELLLREPDPWVTATPEHRVRAVSALQHLDIGLFAGISETELVDKAVRMLRTGSLV